MRVLLFEYLTGGGMLGAAGGALEALAAEGRAMVAALAADLVAAEVELVLLWDRRLPRVDGLPAEVFQDVASAGELGDRFDAGTAECDWTLVIAPETGGLLAQWTDRVRRVGGRLLGSCAATIELATDKHSTATTLRRGGVTTPRGMVLDDGAPMPVEFPYPAVLKPLDGAGSQETFLIHGPDDIPPRRAGRSWRFEAFCPGQPASVAVLCGPQGIFPLSPCWQRLSADGRFTYLGGSYPLPANLARRATRLARRAVNVLPGPLGYVGVDLVLGDTPAEDVVIEINPRLTTSYVGLRRATPANLAAAMLAVAAGGKVKWRWRREPLEFDPHGDVRRGHVRRGDAVRPAGR